MTQGGREYHEALGWYVKYVMPTQEIMENWRAVCAERCQHGSGRGGRKRAPEIPPGGSEEFLAGRRSRVPRWLPTLLKSGPTGPHVDNQKGALRHFKCVCLLCVQIRTASTGKHPHG